MCDLISGPIPMFHAEKLQHWSWEWTWGTRTPILYEIFSRGTHLSFSATTKINFHFINSNKYSHIIHFKFFLFFLAPTDWEMSVFHGWFHLLECVGHNLYAHNREKHLYHCIGNDLLFFVLSHPISCVDARPSVHPLYPSSHPRKFE